MSSGSPPLVSVVTPVYDGEKHLAQCIESVLAQTYTHWDLTVVDNCSADRTLEIARGYAAKDPRIRVVANREFVRVVANHNIAVRQISPDSKYTKVLAADDALMPECLARMVAYAEAHPSVAVVGAYGIRDTQVLWRGLPHWVDFVVGRDACRERLLGGEYLFGTPTATLLRSDAVRGRDPFYNESNLHPDSEACLVVLEHADFGFIHQILTIQGRTVEGTLTSFSERFQTYFAHILYELVTYGPRHLTEAEQQRRIDEHLRGYYRYLGEQVWKRRGAQFWTYHKGKLADAGHPLRRLRLTAAALAYVLDRALNPKRSIEGALAKLRS
ncbi:MAG: glycosyltransferase family 2 protein [Myxococcota bacterium]